MDTRKQLIVDALGRFIRQRPGLEFGNYGNLASYNQEARAIAKDLREATALLRYVAMCDGITADDMIAAARGTYSGRLSITSCAHGSEHAAQCGANAKHSWCDACDPAPGALCHWCHGRGYSNARSGKTVIAYCTGQYFPTEYRRAACEVLASCIWDYWRDHCMPQSCGKVYSYYRWDDTRDEHDAYPYRNGKKLSAGDWLRANARDEFGRGIANRWFT